MNDNGFRYFCYVNFNSKLTKESLKYGICYSDARVRRQFCKSMFQRSLNIDRFWGKQQRAIGRLSERESTCNASVYETAEKYRADNGGPPYGRMVASWNCNLHVRPADVWARDRALFSSSARFRGGDDSAAAPPCEKEERQAGTRETGTKNGR